MMAKMLSVLFLSAHGQEFEDSAVLQVSQVNRHQTTTEGWYSAEQKMHYNFGSGYASLNITASRTSPTAEWSFKAVIVDALDAEVPQSDWKSSTWVCFNDEDDGIDGVCTAQLQQLISGSSNTFLAALHAGDEDGIVLNELTIGKEEQKTSSHSLVFSRVRTTTTICNGADPVDVLSKKLKFEFGGERKLKLTMNCRRKCQRKGGIGDKTCKFKSKFSGQPVWGLPNSAIGCYTKDQDVDADCTAALAAFFNSGKNGNGDAFTKSTKKLGIDMLKYIEQIAEKGIAVGTSAPQWTTLHEPYGIKGSDSWNHDGN